MLNVKEGQLLTVYLRKEGKILKRLHPITLVTLCVSIIFSTLPAYASETTQGSSAVEVTASDREIAANISDEGESEVTTVEEDIDHLDDGRQKPRQQTPPRQRKPPQQTPPRQRKPPQQTPPRQRKPPRQKPPQQTPPRQRKPPQ